MARFRNRVKPFLALFSKYLARVARQLEAKGAKEILFACGLKSLHVRRRRRTMIDSGNIIERDDVAEPQALHSLAKQQSQCPDPLLGTLIIICGSRRQAHH